MASMSGSFHYLTSIKGIIYLFFRAKSFLYFFLILSGFQKVLQNSAHSLTRGNCYTVTAYALHKH